MGTIQSIAYKKVGTHTYAAIIVEEVDNGEYTEIFYPKRSGDFDSREQAQAWAGLAITYFTDRTENGLSYRYLALVEHTEWRELRFQYEGELIIDAEEVLVDEQDGWVVQDGSAAGVFFWTEPVKM